MRRSEADLLIPGRGDPIPNGCIVFDGPAITYAGPVEGAPKATAGTKVDRVPVVLPGLWDCHGHLMGLRSANIEEFAKTALPVLAARAVADARRALLAGFTSVRDLVGLGVHLARTVDEGTIPGPHIHGGGAMLTPTAGHGDLHMFPTSYMRTLEAGGHYVQLCDGVAECLRGVRNQLRVGARVIKVCASGGVMSETDHPIHQQFSEDELRAIVGEAGRAERIVAAHCHGKPGIMAALRAGCGTIEHGSYLDEESVDLLIEKKAILVPTRTSWRCEKIRGRTSQSCPRRRTSWRSGNQVSPSTAVRSRVGTANGASPQTSPLPTERRWIFPSPSSSSRRSSASSSVTPKTAATSRVAQRPRPLRRSRTDSTVASIRLPSIPGST